MSITTPQHTDTRATILDVALELFATKGFGGTSTRELSERLGFTKAALYYHFRTKDDLLLALVEPALVDLNNLVPHGDQRITTSVRRTLLADYVAFVGDHVKVIRVLSRDPSSARSPALIGVVAPVYDRFTQVLGGVDNPDCTSRALMRAALGSIHAALLGQTAADDPAVVQATALTVACRALGIPNTTTRQSHHAHHHATKRIEPAGALTASNHS